MRITNARKSKTLSPSHMKQCIMSESRFDFLRELVKNIPDINVADEQQSDYPERRESSEDGSLSIKASVISNGLLSNPNGAASGSNSHWKFSKQLSVDSTVSKNHNYDNNTPLNYSIKIKVDDQPPPVKLLRMESTPASFGSNNNSAAPIVTPSFLPVTTAKLSDGDKPIINFDFTKIPLLPSAAINTNTATALTHSHSVSNILKLDNKSSETNEVSTTNATNNMKILLKKNYKINLNILSISASISTSEINASTCAEQATVRQIFYHHIKSTSDIRHRIAIHTNSIISNTVIGRRHIVHPRNGRGLRQCLSDLVRAYTQNSIFIALFFPFLLYNNYFCTSSDANWSMHNNWCKVESHISYISIHSVCISSNMHKKLLLRHLFIINKTR